MPIDRVKRRQRRGMVMTANILIADRDPLVRDQCSRFLSAHGYDVATAADGLQCIERLRSCCPDLLVLDPEILWGGGAGVLAWLTCERPVKPIKVVLTDGHRLEKIHEETCDRSAVRLERPTGLATMMEFVSELQRILANDGEAPSRRNKKALLHNLRKDTKWQLPSKRR
jgi:CheY-like chemotaxis protein